MILIYYFLSLISDFFVVVGVVWVMVENSIFRMLPNTWKYFLEKFHNTTKHLKIFSFSENSISGKYFTWTKHNLSTRLFRLLEAKTHFLRAKNESQAFGNFKTHFLKKVVFWNAKNWDKTCVKALLINITIRNARNDPNYSHLTNHKIHWKLKRQT